ADGPGRPGEFHPEPPTDPDVNLSIHPARATPRKPTGFRQDSEVLRLLVDSILTWVTCSLRSTDITPLPRYYEAVRPWSVHRYFRPCGFSTLGLIPQHHRPGSQVPYESLDKSHPASTPVPAWPVSRYLPCCFRDIGKTPVLGISSFCRCFRRFIFIHLSYPHMT